MRFNLLFFWSIIFTKNLWFFWKICCHSLNEFCPSLAAAWCTSCSPCNHLENDLHPTPPHFCINNFRSLTLVQSNLKSGTEKFIKFNKFNKFNKFSKLNKKSSTKLNWFDYFVYYFLFAAVFCLLRLLLLLNALQIFYKIRLFSNFVKNVFHFSFFVFLFEGKVSINFN